MKFSKLMCTLEHTRDDSREFCIFGMQELIRKSLASFAHDENEEQGTAIDRAIAWAKASFFWFTDVCSFDMEQYIVTCLIIWLVTTLQMCHLIGEDYVDFRFDSRVAQVFLKIAAFVSEFPFSEMTAYTISTVLVYSFLAFTFVAALLCHYLGYTYPLYVQRVAMMWLPSFFFLPIAVPHIKMVLPCLHFRASSYSSAPFFTHLTCWHDSHIGFFCLSVITLLLWLPAAFLVTLTYFNADIPNRRHARDNAFNARMNNRPEAYFLLVKAALLTLFIAGRVDSSWRYATSLLLALAGTCAFLHQLAVLPCWHESAQTLAMLHCLIAAWTGLAAFLMTMFRDAPGTGMLYFIGLPFACVAAPITLRWRYYSISALAAPALTTSALCKLKVRSFIRAHYRYLASLGDVYVEDTEELHLRKHITHENILRTFEVGAARFPEDPVLPTFLAAYHTYIDYNRIFAYRAIRMAEANAPPLDTAFRLHVVKRVLADLAHETHSQDVVSYLEFRRREPATLAVTAQAMRKLVQFWSQLLDPNPSIDELASIGHAARQLLSLAVASYEELLRLNPKSVGVLRAYALVCLEVTGDHSKATHLLARAEEEELALQWRVSEDTCGAFLRDVPTIPDLFDERNGVVCINVVPENIGTIDYTNAVLAKLLGFPRAKSLVGKNINAIIPDPIKAKHNDILLRYLVSKQSTVVNRTKMVLAVHAQNHLVPFFAHIRWSDEVQGKMLAVLQPLHSEWEACAIVSPANNVITYATENLSTLFGLSRREVLSRSTLLKHVVGTLDVEEEEHPEHIMKQLFSERGHEYVMAQHTTGQQLYVHAYAQYYRVEDEYMVFVRCLVTPLAWDTALSATEADSKGGHRRAQSLTDFSAEAISSARSRRRASACAPVVDEGDPAYSLFRRDGPRPPALALGDVGSDNCCGSPVSTRHSARAQPPTSQSGRRLSLSTPKSEIRANAAFSHFSRAARTFTEEYGIHAASDTRARGRRSSQAYSPAAAFEHRAGEDARPPHSPSRSSFSRASSHASEASAVEHLRGVFAPSSPSAQGLQRIAAQPLPSSRRSSAVSFHALYDAPADMDVPSRDSGHRSEVSAMSHIPSSRRDEVPTDPSMLELQPVDNPAHLAPMPSPVVSLTAGALQMLRAAARDAAHANTGAELLEETMARPASAPTLASVESAREGEEASVVPEAEIDGMYAVDAVTGISSLAHEEAAAELANAAAASRERASDSHSTIAKAQKEMQQRRRKHEMRTRRQLTLAIMNDAHVTDAKLQWMKIFSVLLLVFVCMLSTATYVLVRDESLAAQHTVRDMYRSAMREAQLTDISYHYRTLQLYTRGDPTDQYLSYFRRGTMANAPAAILGAYQRRIVIALMAFEMLSEVDRLQTRSAELRRLRLADTLDVLVKQGNGVGKEKMSISDAMKRFSSYTRHSLASTAPTDAEDPGFFFALSNGLTVLRDASQRTSTLLFDEMHDVNHTLLTMIWILMSATLGTVMVMVVFFVMPLLRRVEDSKDRVLDIFTSIPYSTRKSMRRKAFHVLSLAIRDAEVLSATQETDQVVEEEDEDDEGEGEHADQAAMLPKDGVTRHYRDDSAPSGQRLQFGQLHVREVPASGSDDDDRRGSAIYRHSPRASSVLTAENAASPRGSLDGRHNTVPSLPSLPSPTLSAPPSPSSSPAGHPSSSRTELLGGDISISGNANDTGSARSQRSGHSSGRGMGDESGTRRVRRSLLKRKSIHDVLTRFLLYGALCLVYYAVVVARSITKTHETEHICQVLLVASYRSPALQASVFFALQNLIFDQAEEQAVNPFDGAAYAGDYKAVAARNLMISEEAQLMVQYGSPAYGLARLEPSDAAAALMSHNVCQMDLTRLQQVIPDLLLISGHIFDNCEEWHDGLLTKGLNQVLRYVADQVRVLLTAPPKLLAHVLFKVPQAVPASPAYVEHIASVWRDLNDAYHDYLGPLMQVNLAYFNADVAEIYQDLRYFYLVMFVAFICLNLLCYLFLFHTAPVVLVEAAQKTKNVLLLLPPDVIRYSVAAQEYIQENISSL